MTAMQRCMMGTLCAVLVVWSTTATAQIEPPSAPVYSASDENGVNFASGSPYFSLWDVAIGSGESTLSHTMHSGGARMGTFADSVSGLLYPTQNVIRPTQTTFYPGLNVLWAGAQEIFYVTSGDPINGPFVSLNQLGSTLVKNADGTYNYTKSDGWS